VTVYQPSLRRRVNRIEASLDIPKDDRHNFEGTLRKAKTRIMEGSRTDDGVIGKKSAWLANDGDEVSVEGLALEGYANLGWNGCVLSVVQIR